MCECREAHGWARAAKLRGACDVQEYRLERIYQTRRCRGAHGCARAAAPRSARGLADSTSLCCGQRAVPTAPRKISGLNPRRPPVLGGTVELSFNNLRDTAQGLRIGRLNGVWLNEAAHEVWVDGERVEPPLSAAQLTLLALLYHSAGRVISRAQIVAAVWPDSNPAGVGEEAVDGLIKRLRTRLRATQPEREYLEVLRGHGLRLVQPDP